MIQLAEDCLIFKSPDGESIPYSSEMITIEIMGETKSIFDTEFIKHAAAAVFHYFRDELGRESVSMSEFSVALEKILSGFDVGISTHLESEEGVVETKSCLAQADLCELISETEAAGELYFFPRLRDELRARLRQAPKTLCFQGLRPCVKRLMRARRWSGRCRVLENQIVEFLRSCMTQEGLESSCALIVR